MPSVVPGEPLGVPVVITPTQAHFPQDRQVLDAGFWLLKGLRIQETCTGIQGVRRASVQSAIACLKHERPYPHLAEIRGIACINKWHPKQSKLHVR